MSERAFQEDAPVTMEGMLEQMQVQKMQAELVAQNNRTASQRWLDTPAKGATYFDGVQCRAVRHQQSMLRGRDAAPGQYSTGVSGTLPYRSAHTNTAIR